MLKSLVILMLVVWCADTAEAASGDTTVARWKYNAKGAFTMSFDDSMETHANIAMPAIVERRLVGTWFINPGLRRHRNHRQVWEVMGPQSGQEYANHTWEHIGARDYPEADFQIGECARYIWALRGPGASKLLAFARGGGTTWNLSEPEISGLKRKYHCIGRSSELSAKTEAGVDGEMLMRKAHAASDEGRWVAIHFHGIGDEWLSIDATAFLRLLDYLRNHRETIWTAGWAAVYQYVQERDSARVDVLEASEKRIRIDLKTGLNTELYSEPLTLITEVPKEWSAVTVIQNGKAAVYQPQQGMLQYEVIPEKGEIELKPRP